MGRFHRCFAHSRGLAPLIAQIMNLKGAGMPLAARDHTDLNELER